MGLYEEFAGRNIIAQVTDEENVKNLLNNKKIVFYAGFDPTADSLHVGSLALITTISRMQKAGHMPIILFGGGTALIGDPTGKTDMRKMLSREEINYNIECFKQQTAKFIDFTPGKAIVVNNADWLSDLNYIDFLREIGVHFSVNRMLAAECYKQRLEKGLSFFELNYMIMQSYDYLVLNRKYNCTLQIGGDDQWSNMISGVRLVKKTDKKDIYAITFKLLTTSDGKKMGKTEKGAIWLNSNKTSPYEFYQYWRNIDDKDVIQCIKTLTFLPLSEIKKYEQFKDEEINTAKEVLAFEVTKLVHGENEAANAKQATEALFNNQLGNSSVPSYTLAKSHLSQGSISLILVLVESGLAPSKNEARRLITQGGIALNNQLITDINHNISTEELEKELVIRKGKKIYKKITI